MSDKNFALKNLKLIPTDGYATIECDGTIELNSPVYVNLNADTVAISTDITIGGQVSSDLIVSDGYYVGIATTNPQKSLHVQGGIRNTNRNTASTQTALHINTTTGDIAETASSRRFKRNIEDYQKGLETIVQLRPVSFQFLEDDLPNTGLIAEEVNEVGLVEFVRYDQNGDPYSIPYDNLSALYINSIKELKAENELLKTKIEELNTRLNAAGI